MNTRGMNTDKDRLTFAQRYGEFIMVLMLLLLLGFFVYHQVAQTGFFTASFGTWEMLCLYGPILCSFAAPVVRAVTGQRNPARPLEVATNLFVALGAIWLLRVFPFDFTHLADALPSALHFMLAWFTNDLGRLILILQIIICPIIALVTLVIYLFRLLHMPSQPLPQ